MTETIFRWSRRLAAALALGLAAGAAAAPGGWTPLQWQDAEGHRYAFDERAVVVAPRWLDVPMRKSLVRPLPLYGQMAVAVESGIRIRCDGRGYRVMSNALYTDTRPGVRPYKQESASARRTADGEQIDWMLLEPDSPVGEVWARLAGRCARS